jgi:hypothetical protein
MTNRVNERGADARCGPVMPQGMEKIRRLGRLRRATGRAGTRLRTAFLFFAAGTSLLAAEEHVSPWDWSATLRSGAGYKDNVLLSQFFKESSVFTFAEAEAFLFRVPLDGWEFTGVFTGEDRRYWQSPSLDKEQLILVGAEVKKAFADRWKAGFAAQYFYNDQVFDASVAEGLPVRIPAKLQRFSGGPLLEYDLHNDRRLELRFALIRQNFELPIDSSWELGPRLTFVQKYGAAHSEFTAMVQWRRRSYDRRAAPGTDTKTLAYNDPEFELGIKHYWDEEKHWKSRGRAGIEFNEDNGDGFFNYRRWKVSQELDFTQGGFEGIFETKFLHYEYTHQVAPDGHARRRTELLFGGRVRKEVVEHVSLFLQAEHEWVLATDFEERYHATTIWGGIEWEIK